MTTYKRRPETPEQENLEVGDGDHTSRRRRLVTAPERKGCILGNQDFFKREFNRVYQKHILSDFPQNVEVRSRICYVVLKGDRLKQIMLQTSMCCGKSESAIFGTPCSFHLLLGIH